MQATDVNAQPVNGILSAATDVTNGALRLKVVPYDGTETTRNMSSNGIASEIFDTADNALNVSLTGTITFEGDIILTGDLEVTGDTTLTGPLDVSGSKYEKVTNVDVAAYTALNTDRILAVTYPSTGACTITIPASADIYNAAGGTSIEYVIQDTSGNAVTNNITLQGTGGETINGQPSYLINNNYQAVTIWTDGNNLFAR